MSLSCLAKTQDNEKWSSFTSSSFLLVRVDLAYKLTSNGRMGNHRSPRYGVAFLTTIPCPYRNVNLPPPCQTMRLIIYDIPLAASCLLLGHPLVLLVDNNSWPGLASPCLGHCVLPRTDNMSWTTGHKRTSRDTMNMRLLADDKAIQNTQFAMCVWFVTTFAHSFVRVGTFVFLKTSQQRTRTRCADHLSGKE